MILKPSEVLPEATKVFPETYIDHYGTDLYLKVCDQSEQIVTNYMYKNQVSTFVDEIGHELWYEIPFCYY